MSKIVSIFLLFSFAAFSFSMDERRQKIIEIIDEELAEVSRLAKQTGYRNPNHLLRMSELYLEKGRLWREKENKEFLQYTNDQRSKINKKKFFRKSQSFFDSAYKYCLTITRKYKKYNRMSEVYYILGYYAKEKGKSKNAAKYLSLATRKSPKKSKLKNKSTISLAELYFNESNFRKAIPLYERALSNRNDKWWTKDSFNLAWSYYRVGRSSNAIAKMEEIYKLSSSDKYIDMREQVKRDIGIMFATSGKIKEGIAFYREVDVDFVDKLLDISKSLKSQGKYSESLKVLNQALLYEKDEAKREGIYIEQLDVYARYNRYKSHLNAAKKLFRLYKLNKISVDAEKKLLFHVQKQGALLQKQVLSKTYQKLSKTRQQKARYAIQYFSMASQMDKAKRSEYLFLQAETAKVSGLTNLAFKKYDETYRSEKGRFFKKSMDGLLFMLGRKSMRNKDKWYPIIYERFVADFALDKRTKVIYEKLFKVYFDQKDYVKARKTLDRYAKKYPKDRSNQEAMIASLMEKERRSKNYPAIKAWVTEINANKYNVSNKYKLKLQELLTSIQIDEVQQKLSKGKKKEALIGYYKVLNDPFATKKARINAKYNIAALYFELRDIDKSFKWTNDAISEMSPKEVAHFSSSFLTISNFYFMSQDFTKSIALSSLLLRKMCTLKNRVKNTAYKNAAFMALADDQIEKTELITKQAKTCKVYNPYIREVEFEILNSYLEDNKWDKVEESINTLAIDKSNRGQLIYYLDQLKTENEKLSNTSFVSKLNSRINEYYSYALKNKLKMKVRDLNVIADEKNKYLTQYANSVTSIRLRFPEKSFNQLMQSKLKKLDALTGQAISIQSIGSGLGIVNSYETLIQSYEEVIKQITNFTPPGKSTDYMKSFKKSMQGLTQPLSRTLSNYKKSLKKSIIKNNILSARSHIILQDYPTVPFIFTTENNGVLMDKRGRL